MGLCGPLSELMTPGCPAAALRSARGLQRAALDRAYRCPWRYLPGDCRHGGGLPADPALARCWLLRGHGARPARDAALGGGPRDTPTAAIFDSATRQSTPESGHRAGYDGYKRRKGSKIHLAVDTLGELLAVLVTPADAQDREQVAALAAAVQDATGQTVELAFVDQGYTGEQPPRTRPSARHPAGGRQAGGGQARLRAAAPALGGGALLRLGGALPPLGQRLRTVARNGGGLAFRGLCQPHAPSFGYRRRAKSSRRRRSES